MFPAIRNRFVLCALSTTPRFVIESFHSNRVPIARITGCAKCARTFVFELSVRQNNHDAKWIKLHACLERGKLKLPLSMRSRLVGPLAAMLSQLCGKIARDPDWPTSRKNKKSDFLGALCRQHPRCKKSGLTMLLRCSDVSMARISLVLRFGRLWSISPRNVIRLIFSPICPPYLFCIRSIISPYCTIFPPPQANEPPQGHNKPPSFAAVYLRRVPVLQRETAVIAVCLLAVVSVYLYSSEHITLLLLICIILLAQTYGGRNGTSVEISRRVSPRKIATLCDHSERYSILRVARS